MTDFQPSWAGKPTGLQKFMSRSAPPPQNDVIPVPTAALDRRKAVAANAKMPPPPPKSQANTQAKLNSHKINPKASSTPEANFDLNDYPPSDQKHIPSRAVPVIPISSTTLGRTNPAFVPSTKSPANPVDEIQARGLFDESTYDEDSDETTKGDFVTRDIYNVTEQIDQRIQPAEYVQEIANAHCYDGNTVSDNNYGNRPFAGQDGTEVSGSHQKHLQQPLHSEQAFRELTDDDMASWSDDDEFNDSGAIKPPGVPAVGKWTDRTGRFKPVQSGPVLSVAGIRQPEVPFNQLRGEMRPKQEPPRGFGRPNNVEESGDGVDPDVDDDDAQQLRNGKSHMFRRESHLDDNEIDMLDQKGRFDGSDTGETESTHNSPTPSLPRSRVVQSQSMGITRTRKRATSELDYDEKTLFSMTYAELQSRPFEEAPNNQPARVLLPGEKVNGPMEDNLKYFAEKEPLDQQRYFQQMSLEEWENAGDWFLEQFARILTEMKHARKSRRAEVKKLEEELAERMNKMEEESDGLDKVLEKMKSGGRELLLGRTL